MNTPEHSLRDLSVGFVHSIVAAIAQHGHDANTLLERFDLGPARLAQPQARLSIPRYMRLGHAAIQLTNNPALGLVIGQQSLLNQLGRSHRRASTHGLRCSSLHQSL